MTPADALFSKSTQRLIGVMFAGADDDALTYAEILRRTSGGSGAIHRELMKFLEVGFVVQVGDRRRRAFRANRVHPLYPELHAIAKKLAAAPERRILDPVSARTLARKYLWWMGPDEAIASQERLVAQVMNMGTFEDIRFVERELGEGYLREVVKNARPGHFEARPWTYWHYRLGLASPGRVPDLPRRRFA